MKGKKTLIIIGIVVTVLVALLVMSSCVSVEDGTNSTLSEEEIASVRESANTMATTLHIQGTTVGLNIRTYEVAEMTNNSYKAEEAYDEFTDNFDDLLNTTKEFLEHINKYPSCFSEESLNSAKELETLYNKTLEASKTTSKYNEKNYIKMVREFLDGLSDWSFVRTQ